MRWYLTAWTLSEAKGVWRAAASTTGLSSALGYITPSEEFFQRIANSAFLSDYILRKAGFLCETMSRRR